MNRRLFLLGSALALTDALFLKRAFADVPKPYNWDAMPPVDERKAFVDWMVANRAESADFLGKRWDRFQALVRNKDLWEDRTKRAFMMTPREEFVLKRNLGRAYDHAFLDIGYGVTISGPHAVSRMTSTIDVKRGEKVLEVGTGSGYQSAILANLTDKVWIRSKSSSRLAERTRGVPTTALIKPRIWRVQGRSPSKAVRRLLRMGGSRLPSTRSSSPAASIIFRRHVASAVESRRHHGDTGRPAGRPARCSR